MRRKIKTKDPASLLTCLQRTLGISTTRVNMTRTHLIPNENREGEVLGVPSLLANASFFFLPS